MTFNGEMNPAILRGKVKASMKGTVYSVEVSLDVDGAILDVKCSCPRGQVICHHMAALCLHAHHNVSVTDTACSCSVKKSADENGVKTLKDLYPSTKHSNYKALCEKVSDESIEAFRTKLGPGNVVGFTWLLRPNAESDIDFVLPSIEDIIFSAEYLEASNKKQYVIEKCCLTEIQLNAILENTVGQTDNENWLIVRKNRITASNFGAVLAAVKRKRYPPSLFKRLTDGYNLSSARAVQWGKEHEKAAIQTFVSAIEGAVVIPTGLWLDKSGFIGASPDGLCGDSCIVEVKCPYKYRNCSLAEALKNDISYIIYKENNSTIINNEHDYYH